MASYWNTIGALCVAGTLSGCMDSGTSSSADIGGSIAFDQSPTVAVSKGSFREVVLSLHNSNDATIQSVRIASSDAGVAEVSPTSCTLSGSSEASSRCTLKVHGKATGNVLLVAQSAGYPDAPLSATVSDAIAYGQLAVATDGMHFVTTTPVSASMQVVPSAQPPNQLSLTAQISGSSGITAASGALINFSSQTAGVTFTPPQCPVTSASPQCATKVSFPASAPTSISVQVVGAITAQPTGYTPIAINAAPSTNPSYGTIGLSTQSGNNVTNGMKAPLFVNWSNPGQQDTVQVNLSIAGSGVSFYSYTPGDNVHIKTAQTQTCTLTNTGTAAGNVLNCGFGLVGTAAAGTVTISATAQSQSKQAYAIAPLTLGVVSPEPARRSITFTNNSSRTIYVGVTGGAANAYLNASTPAVPPGAPTANQKAGAGSLCGPSNPQAACPIGTTCIQGGSAPSALVSSTPFYCYYDQNTPSAGYEIAASGGSTVLNISSSSLAPNGIIWSGNFYARTGCDPTTGACENATCAGAAGGLTCGPGTGPSPGINTLAELTFQAYPATDFYDVSIINGANFATQFGPTNVAVSPTNGYYCGVAGSTTAQNGGFPGTTASTAGLPAAIWAMTPTTASFPPGAAVTGDASSYYRMVVPSSGSSGQSCTTDKTCTSAPDTTCGFRMSDVVTGSFAFDTRYCGKPVAWLTADSIRGFNATSSNAAPFSFATRWTYPSGGTTASVSVGDLQLCINNTYSAYASNGTSATFPVQPLVLACGGVMWGATESPGPLQNPSGNVGLALTPPAQSVQTANANWLTHVLPTITWLKQACPTCYTYPFDDMTSTFTCADNSRTSSPVTNYGVSFSDLR